MQQYLNKLQWFEEVYYLDRGLVSILVKEFSIERENATTTAALLYDIGVKFFNSVRTATKFVQEAKDTTSFQLTKPLIELTMSETQMWIYSLQSGPASAAAEAINKISDDVYTIMNEAGTCLEFLKSVEKRDTTSTLVLVNISIDKLTMIKGKIETIFMQII